MVSRQSRRLQPAPGNPPKTAPPETALTECGLPSTIVERLAAVGINTAADWLALSRDGRRSIWGITGRMVEMVDAAIGAGEQR